MQSDAQGELSPLEVGLHALHSGLSLQEYSDRIGMRNKQSVAERVWAAKVMEACKDILTGDFDKWQHLSTIHPAPRWLWRALVAAMVARLRAQLLIDRLAPR